MFSYEELRSKGYTEINGQWVKAPSSVAGLPKPKPKRQKSKALGSKGQGAKKNSKAIKPIVTFISFRCGNLLDDDNFRGGLKSLRDSVAEQLGMDDAEKFIDWRYYQIRVKTRKEEGTIVKIN